MDHGLQRDVALHFRALGGIPREAIFGTNDPLPRHLPADARTAFPGFVGPRYQPAGTLILGINPGGGGDGYERRSAADERLYSALARLRDSHEAEALEVFRQLCDRIPEVLAQWNLNRIIVPVLQAAGEDIRQIAYLNAVPYRTRNDAAPRARAVAQSWKLVVSPSLHLLRPARIIALGMKAGQVLTRHFDGTAEIHIVPRSRGDRYLSAGAKAALAQIANPDLRRTPRPRIGAAPAATALT